MAFKVFLSYSTDLEDQVIVWRLQTLAAAHGIHLAVPSRSPRGVLLPDDDRRSIDQADCVLAILTSRTGPAVQKELNYALGKSMIIIPIAQRESVRPSDLKNFHPVFWFSAWEDPGNVVGPVVNFLKQQAVAKEQRQAVGALVAIGIGMFMLAAASKE